MKTMKTYIVTGKNIDLRVACANEEEAKRLIAKWLENDKAEFGEADENDYYIAECDSDEYNAILVNGKVIGLKKKQDLVELVRPFVLNQDVARASRYLDSVLVDGEDYGTIDGYSVTRFFFSSKDIEETGIAYVDEYDVIDEDGNVDVVGYDVNR